MNLLQLKHAIRRLSLSQLRKLNDWLHELIKRIEEEADQSARLARKQTVAEQTLDNKTYRLESVRCGKEKCKCVYGKPHGPYWYAYWSEGGKTRSKYLGKRLPQKKNAHRVKDNQFQGD